ncbi:zinc transporter ZIP3-like isoform X2 [Bombus vosnesenskii]|uniref:Zinc transporter ZIP3-like isoform X2 n=4 Tax=Pyrobombus TaxID=144703 RepID=A0A6J3LEJ9_9HYME|nr:zinc transporter ZIP3-like isoform X2 [Bombus impatiens]XP_012247389.1 zinc transporter ZIP3-like isoform X2 [Bombus impatiens]XP_012247390.1 zinc transporter ZIP3-like isoform X2 [Bombus impatiens]XP_024227132.1 zinc transporter ZIP3-like isoform X2 [Bombus impatiens]XP_033179718.1 zinc transporter ZIP3-like isoform X2 [Bombus impatiens]XP_033192946.1 zinc transporter ZIP3-like isoform X2 [Bombus vancouverensis nearcticus]XP_033192947.1 zinc transporter ZIP3-like isoform X2 [Bombus vancou
MSPLEDNTLIQRLTNTVHLLHKDNEDDHEDKNMSNILVAKGVTMVILCTVSIAMGILPMRVARRLKWNTSGVENPRSMKLVSLLLGFGGGVLFCTTFLHLLPEVKEGLEHLAADGKLPELNFSLAETLTCTGFFIMYLVEESVHTHLRKKQAHRKENSNKDVTKSTNELVENGQTLANCVSGHSHYNGHGHSHHLPVIMDEKDDFVISSLRGLLIVLGLSVHELFEGLAIGLESSASYVWYMFAGVAAHKFVIAFCIGLELIASNTRQYLSVIYVCTFAIVSPLGIAIGMFLVGEESATANGILPVLLQGLASGTLLYVVFFEILQEHRTGLQQYISILFGFAVMFGLQILTAHSHSHSHSHSHDGHVDVHSHEVNHQENDHDHKLDSHEHIYSNEMNERILTDKIYRVTESIAETVSNVLSSTMKTPTDVSFRSSSNETTLHSNRS